MKLWHLGNIGLRFVLLALWAQQVAIHTLEGAVLDVAVSIYCDLLALVDSLLSVLSDSCSQSATEVSRLVLVLCACTQLFGVEI